MFWNICEDPEMYIFWSKYLQENVTYFAVRVFPSEPSPWSLLGENGPECLNVVQLARSAFPFFLDWGEGGGPSEARLPCFGVSFCGPCPSEKAWTIAVVH